MNMNTRDNEEMKSETGVLRKSKRSRLEKYKKEIEEHVKLGISIASIQKLINSRHNIDYVYTTYVHYIKNILKS